MNQIPSEAAERTSSTGSIELCFGGTKHLEELRLQLDGPIRKGEDGLEGGAFQADARRERVDPIA